MPHHDVACDVRGWIHGPLLHGHAAALTVQPTVVLEVGLKKNPGHLALRDRAVHADGLPKRFASTIARRCLRAPGVLAWRE
jgi:hypothetical protein